MIDRTEGSQFETLVFEYDFGHPPESLWRALTDPELLNQWLLPVVGLDLEPGASFTFHTEPVGGWDGTVRCRILESDPPRTLSYAWVVGDLDTVVTFTLVPIPTGTRLTLVHTGFRSDQKKNFGGARYGWRMMGQKLIDVMEAA